MAYQALAPKRPSSPPAPPLPSAPLHPSRSARSLRVLSAADAAALAPPAATHEVLLPQAGGGRDTQLRAHEARHAEAMAYELQRGAEALAQAGDYAPADALYTEALEFAPGAAHLLGAWRRARGCALFARRSRARRLTRPALPAARASVRAKAGRAAEAVADARAAVQLAPVWPRGHACLALALQARGQAGPAAEAMAKAAWLARASDGDLAAAKQYGALAEQLRLRKGTLLLDDADAGLLGDAQPAAAEEQERAHAAQAAQLGGGAAPAADAASLEARLRALEAGTAPPQAQPLALLRPQPQAQPTPVVPSLYAPPPSSRQPAPRSLPPGGWQPPPTGGQTRHRF
jgi:hypothetical protein